MSMSQSARRLKADRGLYRESSKVLPPVKARVLLPFIFFEPLLDFIEAATESEDFSVSSQHRMCSFQTGLFSNLLMVGFTLEHLLEPGSLRRLSEPPRGLMLRGILEAGQAKATLTITGSCTQKYAARPSN